MRQRTNRSGWLGCVAIAVMLAGCGKLEKLPETDVDASQKASAQAFATKLYEGCKSGQHEALGNDAIPAMRDGLSPEKQKQACASTTAMFGDYQSMDYAETWKQGPLRVYRFKGHFSKGGAAPEIRVVLDGKGMLSGFWLKPWTETPQ